MDSSPFSELASPKSRAYVNFSGSELQKFADSTRFCRIKSTPAANVTHQLISSQDRLRPVSGLQMLQPRNIIPWRQRFLVSRLPSQRVPKFSFSTSRRLLDNGRSTSPSAIFVPAALSGAKPSFKDSPIRGPDRGLGGPKPSQPNLSVDNLAEYASRILPQTGVTSGRSVSCPPGKLAVGLSLLGRIIRDNNVATESKVRDRVPPHEARRILQSKRHRRRFRQGIARMAGIALRMRRRSY